MDAELDQNDEIDQLLAALQSLIKKASRPVVRACLEEAHDDIAHLVAVDTEQSEDHSSIDAA